MKTPDSADDDVSSAAGAWDRHAAEYLRLFAPLTGYVGTAMVKLVQARLPRGAMIFDIGCGTGDLAISAGRAIAEVGAGRVIATDFSPAMVAHAERAVRAAGLEAHVACSVGDGQDLGFGDATFDAAFSAFGIFLFRDRKTGWREVARVVKPGGWFATSVWRLPEHNELARIQMEPMMQALPDRLTRDKVGPDWRALMTGQGLRAEVCSSAPFVDAEITPFDVTLVIPSIKDMWHAMVGNPVTAPLLAACNPDELAAVEHAALSRFEAHAGGSDRPLVLRTACNILTARRA